MNKTLRQRLGAGLMALCMLLLMPGRALAVSISEIEEEQSRLTQENQSLAARLTELREDAAQKKEYQETLQKRIDVVQEQIDTARKNIDELNARITELTMKLERSQQEIQDTIDQFKERLKALYKAGDISTVQILLDSTSFSDFAMRNEMIKSVTRHDQELMDRIVAYKESTQAERQECEADKKKVADLKKQLESQQEELDGLYQENAQALAELQAAEDAAQAKMEANAAELAANEAKIAELIEAERKRQEQLAASQGGEYLGQNVTYPAGGGGVEGFNPIWPLPGVTYISAGFNGYPGHKGLDIAGPYGTAVVAAESGTVIRANNYDSWGDSWGYYVLIYHNATFTTRYAHLSSVAVSDGQFVYQGQIVGYEGATGNVTGPHLHFEVYCNQVRVDPMLYL